MNRYAARLWAVILIVSLLLPLAACGKDTTATTMRLKHTQGTVTGRKLLPERQKYLPAQDIEKVFSLLRVQSLEEVWDVPISFSIRLFL